MHSWHPFCGGSQRCSQRLCHCPRTRVRVCLLGFTPRHRQPAQRLGHTQSRGGASGLAIPLSPTAGQQGSETAGPPPEEHLHMSASAMPERPRICPRP